MNTEQILTDEEGIKEVMREANEEQRRMVQSPLEQETFLEFLSEKHADGYCGTDDNMPDAFDHWQTELQVDDLIDYADEYREKCVTTAKREALREVGEKVKELSQWELTGIEWEKELITHLESEVNKE